MVVPTNSAEAIVWTTDNGTDVINMSLGGSRDLRGRTCNKVDPTNDAVDDANDKGFVVVAAAGNDHTFLTSYNPNTPVLVVNAPNEFGETARSSNLEDPRAVSAGRWTDHLNRSYLSNHHLAEDSDGYESLNGTSMASPHSETDSTQRRTESPV